MRPRSDRTLLGSPTTLVRGAATAVALGFVVGERAFAIPSPDLVVNLFASAAQVLGLVSIVLGSWFFRGRSTRGVRGGSSRAWKHAFTAVCVLFVLTALGWGFSALAERDAR